MRGTISHAAALDVVRRAGVTYPVTLPKLAQAMYKRGFGWEVQGLPGVTWVAVVKRMTDGDLYAIGHVEIEGYNLPPALVQAFALALEWQAEQA